MGFGDQLYRQTKKSAKEYAMNAIHIVNNLLSSVTNNMHKTRLNAVSACVVSLLTGSSSTVTDIGRGLKSSAKETINSSEPIEFALIYFYRLI